MTERRTFRELADPDEAAAAVADLPIDAGVERVALDDARGRVLAERVDATLDVPGFDRASLDGYALRAADTAGADEADPAELAVVGAVHAGEAPEATVGAGQAVGVSTGAVMPDGADAMVPIERVDELEGASGDEVEGPDEGAAPDAILVRTAVAPGDDVTPAGADVAAGQRALGPGTRLTAREIGLLAAVGEETVPVRGRPTVGVLSTGEELVQPGEPLDHDRGQIYDVNAQAIATAVAAAGGEPRRYPRAGDDPDELAASLREAAADCDLLLTSGSTSAGAVDALHGVLESEGELLLHGVALKPGKPTLVGRIGDCGYVGLPGYPVSAAMVFRTLVAPAIREAAGLAEPERATVEGALAEEARFEPGRRRLLPVGLVERGPSESGAGGSAASGDGRAAGAEPLVYPVDRGSGATTSLTRADGLVTVPADAAYVPAGERVEVELFAPSIEAPPLFGVGEDDPGAVRLLDELDGPRYLPDGTDAGLRRLRDGVPDVAVAAEPHGRSIEAPELAAWQRRWGLVVPEGNPDGVEGLADLVDRELRLANLAGGSGLRSALDEAVAELADELGDGAAAERTDVAAERDGAAALRDRIDGYGVGLRGTDSPARRVLDGDADVGLGLAVTAARPDLAFVPLGEQRVVCYANADRTAKPGVAALERAVEELPALFEALSGYEAE